MWAHEAGGITDPLALGVDDFGITDADGGRMDVFPAYIAGMVGDFGPLGLEGAAHSYARGHLIAFTHGNAEIEQRFVAEGTGERGDCA